MVHYLEHGITLAALPMDYSVFIPNDDSVRLVRYVLGLLNLSALYKKYQDTFKIKEGRPRYNCFVLLSVIVYGYQQGLYSSRQIARACKRDINFTRLLNGERVPSHNLINRFRKHILDEVIEDIFYQMIKFGIKFGCNNFFRAKRRERWYSEDIFQGREYL